MFTGALKKDFENWLSNQEYGFKDIGIDVLHFCSPFLFKDLPFSMQWGVYEEFIHSKNHFIHISLDNSYSVNKYHIYLYLNFKKKNQKYYRLGVRYSLSSARERAIEIFNQKNQ